MFKLDVLALGRSIQRHIKTLKSVGYSHPPQFKDGVAKFYALDHFGNKYEVSVRPISLDEELDALKRFENDKKS